MNFFSSIFKTMSKGPTPPKLFDPTAVSMRGWMKKFNEEYLKNGLGPTYNKLRMLNYFRSGTLVGTDTNGNKYYENKDAPYGRYRWVEPATPTGVWAIEDQYDASQARRSPPIPITAPPRSPPARPAQISPEWHGWLHYQQDKTGQQVNAEFNQPFRTAHTINPTLKRPVYPGKHINPDGGADYYTPPGQWGNTVARGRVGKKYQAWDGQSKSAEPAEIRNYYDNRKTLDIP